MAGAGSPAVAPAAECGLDEGGHVETVEVTGDGHRHSGGADVLGVEGGHVVAGDRTDRLGQTPRGARAAVGCGVVGAHELEPGAGSGHRAFLLDLGQSAAHLSGDLRGREGRLGEDLSQQVERRLEVALDDVEVEGESRLGDAGAEADALALEQARELL